MKKAILGKKVGMTQIFTDDGLALPVTVIEAGPCVVVQKKTVETDGYNALKVGFYDISEKRVNKPDMGQFKKAGTTQRRYLKELRLEDVTGYEVGQEIKVEDMFADGDMIDVSGVSKGKGMQGTIKKYHQSGGPESHGSMYHRRVGSNGANTSPARVFKGKRLPGHMGNENVTVQNLSVVRVDKEKKAILIKGAVPGPKGGLVMIKNSVKHS